MVFTVSPAILAITAMGTPYRTICVKQVSQRVKRDASRHIAPVRDPCFFAKTLEVQGKRPSFPRPPSARVSKDELSWPTWMKGQILHDGLAECRRLIWH